MSDEEAAKERLAKVAQGVNQVCDGDAFTIECPYCGKVNLQDGFMCCGTFKRAVKAVLDAREKFSKIQRHMVN